MRSPQGLRLPLLILAPLLSFACEPDAALSNPPPGADSAGHESLSTIDIPKSHDAENNTATAKVHTDREKAPYNPTEGHSAPIVDPPASAESLAKAGSISGPKVSCDRACVGGSLDGDDLRTPIDREHGLRPEWAPHDLVALDMPYVIAEGSPPNLLRMTAAEAFIRLSDAALEATGVRINIRSGYRTFALQCSIFRAEIHNLGCLEATRASARAGFSEHQLGTTADLAIGWRRLSGDAPIDTFLDAHAHDYGWVLSYPDGAEQLTGYKHEPWHYRYLGTAAARDLVHRSGPIRRLSTQEYLAGTAEIPE